MSTHIVTQEHLSITDTSISLLAVCGATRAMVSISTDRVTIILHYGPSERAQAFIYGGAHAMQTAMQRHEGEEIRAILMLADRRNA